MPAPSSFAPLSPFVGLQGTSWSDSDDGASCLRLGLCDVRARGHVRSSSPAWAPSPGAAPSPCTFTTGACLVPGGPCAVAFSDQLQPWATDICGFLTAPSDAAAASTARWMGHCGVRRAALRLGIVAGGGIEPYAWFVPRQGCRMAPGSVLSLWLSAPGRPRARGSSDGLAHLLATLSMDVLITQGAFGGAPAPLKIPDLPTYGAELIEGALAVRVHGLWAEAKAPDIC